jgi:hypothetical protein
VAGYVDLDVPIIGMVARPAASGDRRGTSRHFQKETLCDSETVERQRI